MMSTTTTTVIETNRNPGCLLQLLWFAFIGVWLGQAWMVVAWLLMVTIIGIPAGIWMMNRLPKIITLREPEHIVRVTTNPAGGLVGQEVYPPQVNFLLRGVYFLLIGWWLSALWMEAAYVLCLTIIGLPIGFWMFDRVPGILSLKR